MWKFNMIVNLDFVAVFCLRSWAKYDMIPHISRFEYPDMLQGYLTTLQNDSNINDMNQDTIGALYHREWREYLFDLF